MNRGRAVLALGSVLAGLEWQRGRPLNSVVRHHEGSNMETLPIYFAGLLARNLAFALFLFAIVVFSRRKDRSVTPVRGLLVFLISWLGGSAACFLILLLFAATGTQVEGGQLEMPVAILVILPIAYASYTWLSEAKVKVG